MSHRTVQEAGILGLAAFLKNSKRLTILWSPLYFKRLPLGVGDSGGHGIIWGNMG